MNLPYIQKLFKERKKNLGMHITIKQILLVFTSFG